MTGKRETNSPGMKFGMLILAISEFFARIIARPAQSAERKALNLVVVGSSPTVGVERNSAKACVPLVS